MMEEGIITRFEGGPETVYGIAEGQAPIASFYRNTIVHFFLTRAVAELALLAVSEQRESHESLSQFWSEVQELRDLFKFEFFYPDTQLFEQQIDAELCRDESDWQALLSEEPRQCATDHESALTKTGARGTDRFCRGLQHWH